MEKDREGEEDLRRTTPGSIAALAAMAACIAITGTMALAEHTPPGVVLPLAKDPNKLEFDRYERGKYLAEIGGCHDCHTPGYAANAGKVPAKDHLIGDKLGWKGDWGTTYPTNLRSFVGRMTEEQWVVYARNMEPRPPMPWFNVRAMTDADLRAIHTYVTALGPGGEEAPAFVPPGEKVAGPVIQFPTAN